MKAMLDNLWIMFFRVLGLLVLFLLVIVAVPAAAQSELERAREKVSELQGEVDVLFERLLEVQDRVDAAGAAYWDADHDLYELQIEIDSASQQEAELLTTVEEMRGRITEIAIERYVNSGKPSPILAGEDISRQVVIDALAKFVSEGALDILDDYRLALDDLAAVQERLAAQTALQQEIIVQADVAWQSVQQDLEAIGDMYLEVAAKLYEQDRVLDGLEEEERLRLAEELRRRQAEQARRIEAARAAAERKAAAEAAAEAAARRQAQSDAGAGSADSSPPPSSPPTSAAGSLRRAPSGWVCPLAGPFSHVNDWRAPRHHGGWHKGNDLMAPTGTPVLAVESGRLEHRFNRIGGNSAYIYADSGNYYYNTHLSAYENVGVGWVPAGTVIGYVGATGNAGIPHLHFEYHKGGRGNYINPYPFVREACF